MYRVCFRSNYKFLINGISDTKLFDALKVTSVLAVPLKTTYNLSTTNNEKWDLLSAVCVERRPVITKPFSQLERKFYTILNEMEAERSHKSNHEIRRELDKALAKTQASDIDSDKTTHQTAQDFEDAAQDEYKKFKFANRTTQADEKNDTTSLDRMLDHSLVLLIKKQLGKDLHWIFPQGIHQEGETMRQTAERVLKENCGDQLKTNFLGNAPCGFYKYKYPKDIQKSSESVGAKIFFFKAQFVGGDVKCKDYKWLTQKELDGLHQDYKKSIDMFLISDS